MTDNQNLFEQAFTNFRKHYNKPDHTFEDKLSIHNAFLKFISYDAKGMKAHKDQQYRIKLLAGPNYHAVIKAWEVLKGMGSTKGVG